MQKVFDFISDPGHGWVKVPVILLQSLCISNNISGYSYMRGKFAYLEEDCDASLFINALENLGVKFTFNSITSNNDSPIRMMKRYTK